MQNEIYLLGNPKSFFNTVLEYWSDIKKDSYIVIKNSNIYITSVNDYKNGRYLINLESVNYYVSKKELKSIIGWRAMRVVEKYYNNEPMSRHAYL